MKKSLLLLLIFTFGVQAQNFWTEVAPFPANPSYYPSQISIAETDVVWVSGADLAGGSTVNKWSRSIDAGITWTEGDINLGSADLMVSSLHAVSATTAYVSVFPNSPSMTGGVWITQDSGATWTQQTSATFTATSFPNFIHFWNNTNGIVVGDPQNDLFEIYTTSDAGITWTPVPASNIPVALAGEYGYSLHYESRNNSIWYGTNMGRIFRSTDQGLNWMVIQSPVSDFGSSNESGNFAFRNENEGLLITGNHILYRTIDGGIYWTQEIPDGVLRNFNVVFVPETNNAYFNWGTDEMEISRGSSYSTNGGMDWIDLNDADDEPVEPIEVEFQSGTVGYCIGRYLLGSSSETKFFRLTDPLNRLLKNNEFETADAFSVYPNPTNGIVKIAGENIAGVEIYDITGKEIFSNDYDSLTEVLLDVSIFQDGIYIAKISSDSGSSSTVKIVKK